MTIAYFAHSTPSPDKSTWHTLRDHLTATSALATQRAVKFGAGRAGALAGLLHDLGKYTPAFQGRLLGSTDAVDHSTAGAKEIRRLVVEGADRAMAELIAYAIAGHHAGLPDGTGGAASLFERMGRQIATPDPIWRQELPVDVSSLCPATFNPHPEAGRRPFQLAFLGRMVFSCLVDADFRDTEAFYAKAEGYSVDRQWPSLPGIVADLRARFDASMARKRAVAAATPLNRLRGDILRHVRSRAELPAGIFTLTVPTGGGKTLASLAFALDHAKRHGMHRIVYAIPFTSIIDQTAAIFRDILGEENLLEHHSALEDSQEGGRQARDKLRLAMEDWAAPVVVTTNVQLFESLFANRPARCRKLHNLARSVIILDEAQTIPVPLLRPCVAALDELARNYGTTIVLCTATQPALAAPGFIGGLTLDPSRELAPDPHKLAAELKRVVVRRAGDLADDALIQALADAPQSLVIVNSRAHALQLYRKAAAAGLSGVTHLTTRHYAAHRREILDTVRRRLKAGQPCRLVATSLVEAGVDLDFPRVWRAEAGLDQIAQASGRCNREGTRAAEDSIVTVFRAPEHPAPREIVQLSGDFARIAERHEDLQSLAAITDYFKEVYWRKGEGLDAGRVLPSFKADGRDVDFAYRTVAEKFRLVESGLVPAIIARDSAAQAAVEKLKLPNISAGAVARALQPYIVQIPPKARTLLFRNGHIEFIESKRFGDQFAILRTAGLYSPECGLLWEDAEYLALESSIF